MDFVALDVETANADMSSICQIGLARFKDRTLVDAWKTLVDPQDHFDPINVSIHHITVEAVRGAPCFPSIANELGVYLKGTTVVCHTHFDRIALQQCFWKHRLEMPDWIWLDSARVVRRTWEQFAWRGYGLGSVCGFLGLQFAFHDALEDAKAAGFILLAAMDKTGLDVTGLIDRVEMPIGKRQPAPSIEMEYSANPEGPLFGEILVFTGALTIPRAQAANWAAQIGCEVGTSVTKKTTILVVGDQDVMKPAGHEKSTKHRKAEELIHGGQAIRILREADFRELVTMALGNARQETPR
jgi:DNA polymerase-3 subunit epsilon